MKILLIAPGPLNSNDSGGSIRTNAFRETLLETGDLHTIEIRFSKSFGWERQWGPSKNRILSVDARGRSVGRLLRASGLRRQVRRMVEDDQFDLIVVRYLSSMALVPRRMRRRTLLDADDLIKTGEKPFGLAKIRLTARNLLAPVVVRRVAHVWVTSERDRARLARNVSASVLRNIAPSPGREPDRASSTSHRVIMVGLFLHGPNVEAAQWFVEQVLPGLRSSHPDTQLHLIGRGSETVLRSAAPGVVVRGFVDDLDDEYDAAAVAVAPVFTGAGTQIKVIDSLLHGCPVVVSAFAFGGFRGVLDESRHVFVAATAEQWVDRLRVIFDHAEMAESTAAEGRAVAMREFSRLAFHGHVRQSVVAIGEETSAAVREP